MNSRLKALGVKVLSVAVALSLPVLAASVSGQKIYTTNCAGCHGAKAQGGVGPSLHPVANWSYDLFKRAMLKNVNDKGQPLKPPMPHWGKVGFAGDNGKAPTDAEMKALQAYLKTLK